jgi:hypothetical protein
MSDDNTDSRTTNTPIKTTRQNGGNNDNNAFNKSRQSAEKKHHTINSTNTNNSNNNGTIPNNIHKKPLQQSAYHVANGQRTKTLGAGRITRSVTHRKQTQQTAEEPNDSQYEDIYGNDNNDRNDDDYETKVDPLNNYTGDTDHDTHYYENDDDVNDDGNDYDNDTNDEELSTRLGHLAQSRTIVSNSKHNNRNNSNNVRR